MPRKRVRRIESLISDAVRDLVFPTSVGLGLVVAGCGGSNSGSDGSSGKAETSLPVDTTPGRGMDVPMWAIMPPRFDADPRTKADAAPDMPVYAILPPAKDAGAPDTAGKHDSGPIYAIMAPLRDAGSDERRNVDAPIYAIMAPPPARDAGKADTPPIYAILPILPRKA